MVQSGLSARTSVSHYRLAAHLMVALALLSDLFWLWLILEPRTSGTNGEPLPATRRLVFVTLGFMSLQFVYGAFTAGLKAGYGYNTFPKMLGYWFHPDAVAISPLWRNFLDNPAMVQLVHRTVGWFLSCSALILIVSALRHASGRTRTALLIFSGSIWIQFMLGALTLVNQVPIALASIHQAFACWVLLAGLRAVRMTKSSQGALIIEKK